MIVVSGCLVGENCKYNGGNNKNQKVLDFLKGKKYITVCPEMLGNLPCPRYPSEIVGEKVINKIGQDVTENFISGGKKALEIALCNKCTSAILKEGSPSCGNNFVYDGSFTNKKIQGQGITAKMFKEMGIEVISENDV
jgi:uncharacterized protein YbbK (DUF523 family)